MRGHSRLLSNPSVFDGAYLILNMNAHQDSKIYWHCKKYIEQHSMDIQSWQHTILGRMHNESFELQLNELPLVSVQFSPTRWCLLTTRRVLGEYLGSKVEIAPQNVTETDFGDFKGVGGKRIEAMTLSSAHNKNVYLEYETGKASMAVIHYFRFWGIKYPILDKLVDVPSLKQV